MHPVGRVKEAGREKGNIPSRKATKKAGKKERERQGTYAGRKGGGTGERKVPKRRERKVYKGEELIRLEGADLGSIHSNS